LDTQESDPVQYKVQFWVDAPLIASFKSGSIACKAEDVELCKNEDNAPASANCPDVGEGLIRGLLGFELPQHSQIAKKTPFSQCALGKGSAQVTVHVPPHQAIPEQLVAPFKHRFPTDRSSTMITKRDRFFIRKTP